MYRHAPYPERFLPFFGGPLIGGFLGGLLGSALVRPRPFYPYAPAPVPYQPGPLPYHPATFQQTSYQQTAYQPFPYYGGY
ncbi:hypothetical protein [Heyndrickxia acidiproducens]|uniref:hypothetical protein n=1 Tax=Heyndrickxia acidiproducens TaxID=1121084 RepID=UPI0009D9BDF5|nr:hypothetical protein [Heyndrickxia acidiproducens]